MRKHHKRSAFKAVLICTTLLLGLVFTAHPASSTLGYSGSAAVLSASPPASSPFNYIVIIIMENNGIEDIINSSSAPYMNQLASGYSLATQYTAASHPSLPNYLALTSGSTHGITDDSGPDVHPISSPSIVDRIEAAGLTWKAYMEDMPSACYVDDSGSYSVHHNPFVYYTSITSNPARCNSHVVPANTGGSGLRDDTLVNDLASTSTASNYMWLTPNMCNDMHDCSVDTGDLYLSELVPQILNSTIFKTQKAALLITFDEGNGDSPTDFVYTVWAGLVVKTHYKSLSQYSHYSLLKTIESSWNLQALSSDDNSASAMSEFFTGSQPGGLTGIASETTMLLLIVAAVLALVLAGVVLAARRSSRSRKRTAGKH